jgi:hypothetical protein
VRLDEGFTATGGGSQRAVVSLAGAQVGGQLSCTGRAAGGRPDAPALDLGRAQVGGLRLSTGFGTALNFDGLTYTDAVLLAGNPPARVSDAGQAVGWISCFRHCAPYSAQAYQQLARVYRARGDEAAVRRVLLAQDADARARAFPTRLGKALRLARGAVVAF